MALRELFVDSVNVFLMEYPCNFLQIGKDLSARHDRLKSEDLKEIVSIAMDVSTCAGYRHIWEHYQV